MTTKRKSIKAMNRIKNHREAMIEFNKEHPSKYPLNKIWYSAIVQDKTRDKSVNNPTIFKRILINEYKVQESKRGNLNRGHGILGKSIRMPKHIQESVFDDLKQMYSVNYVQEHDALIFTALHTYMISQNDIVLSFSPGNTKIMQQGKDYNLNADVLDLQSGETCPAAKHCKVKVLVQSNDLHKRIRVKSDNNKYDCFATKAEGQYIITFVRRVVNSLIVKYASEQELIDMINQLLQVNNTDILRFHGAGDFFKKYYFDASIKIARMNPDKVFYGYTKMLPFKMILDEAKLDNYGLIYSGGGVYDDKAFELKVNAAFVDVDKMQYDNLSYACVNKEDDFEYILAGESFLLHLH